MDRIPAIAMDVDEITCGPPGSPSYREGVSIWIWDDGGRFCFPRVGVEAVGATWTTLVETAFCQAWPDGRLLLVNEDAPPLPVQDASGQPRVLGTESLRFECIEPFTSWRVRFDGRAVATTVEGHLGGGVPKLHLGQGEPGVAAVLDVRAHSVAPPWFQGTYDPDGLHVAGEHRFEQLCAVDGHVVVNGETQAFAGGGLRVHRKGGPRNDYGEFHGHVWASAVFPSGKAFGVIHYKPGPDATPRYHEAWVRDAAGETHSAKAEETPWLSRLTGPGEDLSLSLRHANGRMSLNGTTFAASIRPPRPTAEGTQFPVLHSAIARFRLGDEEAFGMIERSARLIPELTSD